MVAQSRGGRETCLIFVAVHQHFNLCELPILCHLASIKTISSLLMLLLSYAGIPRFPHLLQVTNGRRFGMITRWPGWCHGQKTSKDLLNTSCWTPVPESRYYFVWKAAWPCCIFTDCLWGEHGHPLVKGQGGKTEYFLILSLTHCVILGKSLCLSFRICKIRVIAILQGLGKIPKCSQISGWKDVLIPVESISRSGVSLKENFHPKTVLIDLFPS